MFLVIPWTGRGYNKEEMSTTPQGSIPFTTQKHLPLYDLQGILPDHFLPSTPPISLRSHYPLLNSTVDSQPLSLPLQQDIISNNWILSTSTRPRFLKVAYVKSAAYERDLHAFQGRQRHHGRFGTPEEENRGGRAGGSNCRRVSPGDAALGHALRWRCRGRLAITRATEEDDGGDRGRALGVWPHRIGGQDWDHVLTCEGGAGVHRQIQRRGSGPGVQLDGRVCILQGGRQP